MSSSSCFEVIICLFVDENYLPTYVESLICYSSIRFLINTSAVGSFKDLEGLSWLQSENVISLAVFDKVLEANSETQRKP